ncbi:MAG: cytochrome c [Bacteroidota bacterium]
MQAKRIIKYLAPFTILLIVVIFIVNIFSHGSIQHPGKSSYQTKCADCHGDEGQGIKTLVPPLANSDFALQHFDSIPCWLKNGIHHPIVVNGVEYDQPMYGVEMDEIQIANVMNYISKELLNSDKQINSIQVKEQLKGCK